MAVLQAGETQEHFWLFGKFEGAEDGEGVAIGAVG